MATIEELRAAVLRLRRNVYGGPVERTDEALRDLAKAEADLADLERAAKGRPGGLLFKTESDTNHLGFETTGLEAECRLRMAQVPTAIAHLLDPAANPLITCTVRNQSTDGKTRRVRVTSFVEGYSAQAISSFEIPKNTEKTFDQLPTFFPDRLSSLNELTRATLHVQVDDLDGKVELHRTEAIWLLPRTTAPLAVKDPHTGDWSDLTRYLGAFVTPNAPELESVLNAAVALAPGGAFVSYQDGAAGVNPQVNALFDALKARKLRYVNSVLAFSPDDGFSSQRVRLPRQALDAMNANCIDGTVLLASLLEAITLRPGIALIPGHAFVAWQTDPADDASWEYLETTLISTETFDAARAVGGARASAFQKAAGVNNPHLFRLWPLHQLRGELGILPME